MKKIVLGLRMVLGIALLVFGVNKFVNIMNGFPLKGKALQAMEGIAATGYILPMVGFFEVLLGIILISGKFTALTLVLLAPISLNLVMFHVGTGDFSNILPSFVVAALNLLLLFYYRDNYRPLFEA